MELIRHIQGAIIACAICQWQHLPLLFWPGLRRPEPRRKVNCKRSKCTAFRLEVSLSVQKLAPQQVIFCTARQHGYSSITDPAAVGSRLRHGQRGRKMRAEKVSEPVNPAAKRHRWPMEAVGSARWSPLVDGHLRKWLTLGVPAMSVGPTTGF